MACTAGVQQYPASCSRMRHAEVIISVDAHSGRDLGVRARPPASSGDLSRFYGKSMFGKWAGARELDLSHSTSARHGSGTDRTRPTASRCPFSPVTAIGVRISRPEILTVGVRIELLATAGVFDDRLCQNRCCERCGGNGDSANQCNFHLGLLDNERIGSAKYIRTRLQNRQ